MEINKDYVTEVSTAMLEGKAAFMVGAGISLNRNSWLPDWEGLIYELLKSVAGNDRNFELKYIHDDYMQLLFNEVFLHLMSETLGSGNVESAIKKCMDVTEYNLVHKFLAWSMLNFHCLVLTTNYDELIERAGNLKIKPVKLHGTLSKPESMRFTVNQIFSPLAPEIINSTAKKLNGRTLVVMGYRGADEFDVIPFLFDQSNLTKFNWKFIWITHGDPEKDLDSLTRKRLDERGEPYFKANADDFLKAVYDSTKELVGNDNELDQWDKWELGHSGKTKGWWKQALASWEECIKEAQKSDVDLLWAKILDYLRIYELNYNGIIRRPAEEAYECFLKTKPNTIQKIESKLQLAYIRRITRIDESEHYKTNLITSFQNIIKIIENEISALEKNDDNYFRLQKLQAKAHHELGVALQNQCLYSQANLNFNKAIKIRRLTDDPEVAYSIFLQFMNSVRAYRAKQIMDIKEFCPGWKKSLLCELRTSAQLFREASEPHHFSTTLHNLAYVHQVLAEEHEKTERFDIANREYLHACKMYENAKVIRERLRDPRRIAQSNVRIAECKLGLARCALINACEFVEEATKLANEVDEHYRKIPQEEFRGEDLQNIRNWIIRLKNKACID